MLEKAKSLEKKIKESVEPNSQKTNVETLSAIKNDDPVGLEINPTTKSDEELAVKPVDEEIKNLGDSSLKNE